MKTRSEYLELLKSNVLELKERFGVRSFRILVLLQGMNRAKVVMWMYV